MSAAPAYKGPTPGKPAANATPAEVESYIRTAASSRGIDPETALRVVQSEGGLEPNRTGTFATGSSWGPLQLHWGGKGYEHLGTVAGMGNTFTAKAKEKKTLDQVKVGDLVVFTMTKTVATSLVKATAAK